MKTLNLFKVFCFLFSLGLLTQCEKNGTPGRGIPALDEDSDRPEWAGGNTGANDHNKKDEGGTSGGSAGEYGDLLVLYRDLCGVPVMTPINVDGVVEYFVQPLSAIDGQPIDLDAFGEIPVGAATIPVEFGRLNIVRSPQSVLDQAMGEALKVINAGVKFSLDYCGRLTIWNTDPISGTLIITKTIDSPRESMALYQEIMNKGFSGKLVKLVGTGIDPFMLAASCFAAGSDKTGTVNIDEVVYINGFINCLGCCPIDNDYEYDFDGAIKQYFNFGELQGGNNPFTYNRETTYKDRYLKILILNADGTYVYETFSVMKAMEDRGLFMYRWEGTSLTHVNGFAAAVDDAVQVLEFVHGDSNIEFLPEVPN